MGDRIISADEAHETLWELEQALADGAMLPWVIATQARIGYDASLNAYLRACWDACRDSDPMYQIASMIGRKVRWVYAEGGCHDVCECRCAAAIRLEVSADEVVARVFGASP